MKTLLALLLTFAAVLQAQAQLSPLRLETKLDSKVENDGKQGSTKTQTRKIEMVVTNLSQAPYDKVQVHWWFFARDLKKGGEEMIKKGSTTISVGANNKQAVASDVLTTSYTEEHAEAAKSGNKGGGGKNKKAKFKTVEASGERFTGYAVQVTVNGQVAADFYSNPSYKDKVGAR